MVRNGLEIPDEQAEETEAPKRRRGRPRQISAESRGRVFWLVRREDITGISGTGVVADGVQFPDGTTVVRWRPRGTARPDVVKPTTVVHPDMESVIGLHGHNGATRVVWADVPDPLASLAES